MSMLGHAPVPSCIESEDEVFGKSLNKAALASRLQIPSASIDKKQRRWLPREGPPLTSMLKTHLTEMGAGSFSWFLFVKESGSWSAAGFVEGASISLSFGGPELLDFKVYGTLFLKTFGTSKVPNKLFWSAISLLICMLLNAPPPSLCVAQFLFRSSMEIVGLDKSDLLWQASREK